MKVIGSDIVCEIEDMIGFEAWLASASFMSDFREAVKQLNASNTPYLKRRLVLLGGTFFGMPIVIGDTKK